MSKVALGVSGSIAAYKACDLVSKLVQRGHGVDVVMTTAACRFVQPLTFAALSHREVFTDETWFSGKRSHEHLSVTEAADLLVVAPATANLIAKCAAGIADEVLSATVLAAACPVLLAPAMNKRMWGSPRTQANIARLHEDGMHRVGPAEGYLSEAEHGIGRMSEPTEILEAIESLL